MINLKSLIEFLPFEFKDKDTYKVDGKGILERFLEICGNYFEEEITPEIDNILDIIDLDKTENKYLNYLWEFLGQMPFAKTGIGNGVPNLSETQVRNLLRYSLSLLKIRGSKQFFEILFRSYGLTCTITDPAEGSMDEWVKLNPTYDGEYSIYDRYHYDKIYGCTQCIRVNIQILGHGFTSSTIEFKSFKASIEKLFDRFIPYNVTYKINYGFDEGIRYTIMAEPLVTPIIVPGQVSEIPIKVTVQSNFEDADLRYQVTGYPPSENKWSSKKYSSEEIFYAKKGNQTYYFRSVGDNSVTTQVRVNIKYISKSYHIFYEILEGGNDSENLVLSASNLKIKVKISANVNYDGVVKPLNVQLLNNFDIKPSGSIWEITSADEFKWVIAEFPVKSVSLKVTSLQSLYSVICTPRNINLTKNEKSTITIKSSNPDENLSVLKAVCLSDSSIVLNHGQVWAPQEAGTYIFKCTKDETNDSQRYGTIVAYKLSHSLKYSLEIAEKAFLVGDSVLTPVTLSSGVPYKTFISNRLYEYFDTEIDIYRQRAGSWEFVQTLKMDVRKDAVNWLGEYSVLRNYKFTAAGFYKFVPKGDLSVAKVIEVSIPGAPVQEYLWIQPLDSEDNNWSSLVPYSEDNPIDKTKYIKATYNLPTNKECQFYLRYGKNRKVSKIKLEGSNDEYESNILCKFKELGTYKFKYMGSTVELTIKQKAPTYQIKVNPSEASLGGTVTEVTTVVTVTSDTGESGEVVYETVPDVAHSSPYTFKTNLPGNHKFYVKGFPHINAIFKVNMTGIVDKTELIWEADNKDTQEVNINLPDGVQWQVTLK